MINNSKACMLMSQEEDVFWKTIYYIIMEIFLASHVYSQV